MDFSWTRHLLQPSLSSSPVLPANTVHNREINEEEKEQPLTQRLVDSIALLNKVATDLKHDTRTYVHLLAELHRQSPILKNGCGAATRQFLQLATHPERKDHTSSIQFAPLPRCNLFSIVFMRIPWAKRTTATATTTSTTTDSLTIHELAQFQPSPIVASNAAVLIWTTLDRIEDTILLGEWWGFEYIGVLFVCIALEPRTQTPFLGTGRWTRSNAEVVLFFSKGNPKMCIRDKTVSQLIFSQIPPQSSPRMSPAAAAVAAEIVNTTGASIDTERRRRTTKTIDDDDARNVLDRALREGTNTTTFGYAKIQKRNACTALFFHPRIQAQKHKTPQEFYSVLARVMRTDLPCCELFASARSQTPENWVVWGTYQRAVTTQTFAEMVVRDEHASQRLKRAQSSTRGRKRYARAAHTSLPPGESLDRTFGDQHRSRPKPRSRKTKAKPKAKAKTKTKTKTKPKRGKKRRKITTTTTINKNTTEPPKKRTKPNGYVQEKEKA